ncbi:MAG: chemotaxis protein CheW [Bdellovibrionaceae bacterium]|nr:chemotaxis protein CheW [Pseudobdellovibrionaceae bacterium]
MASETRVTIGAEIYGSFFLNSSEFALAIKSIQEVVTPPEKLTPMPLSPDYMVGVFNLRGVIIPVIDLKIILKIGGDTGSLENKKVSIIDHEGTRIGLLFDRTGQIFRNCENEKSDFDYSGQGGNVVSGAIKIEEGRRIIQILDVRALFRLENVPHMSDPQGLLHAQRKAQRNQGRRAQCISFLVAQNRLGFSIEDICEIIKPPELQEAIVGCGDVCLGMFDLRGDIVPVIDFAAVLKYRKLQNRNLFTEEQRILVMKTGSQKIGLLIDSVESIITYYEEEILPIPLIGPGVSRLFLGCLATEGRGDVILLKSAEILSQAETSEVARCYGQLHKASQSEVVKKRAQMLRKSYIAFKIDHFFAVEMDEVRELIEYPKDIMRPPALSPFVKGLLNLRGKMVTILDAKILYGIDKPFVLETAKVLIFERLGVSFGLVVDSVENIVSFSEDQKLKIPDLFCRAQGASGIFDDVTSAVEVEIESAKKSVMILSLDALVRRTGFAVGRESACVRSG